MIQFVDLCIEQILGFEVHQQQQDDCKDQRYQEDHVVYHLAGEIILDQIQLV